MLLLGAMWEHGLQSVGHHPDTSFQRHLSQGKQGSWMDMSADIHVNLILHSLRENERRHRGLQGSMELLCCCCSGLSTKRAKEKQGKQRQESQDRRAGGTALFFTPAILCVSSPISLAQEQGCGTWGMSASPCLHLTCLHCGHCSGEELKPLWRNMLSPAVEKPPSSIQRVFRWVICLLLMRLLFHTS